MSGNPFWLKWSSDDVIHDLLLCFRGRIQFFYPKTGQIIEFSQWHNILQLACEFTAETQQKIILEILAKKINYTSVENNEDDKTL